MRKLKKYIYPFIFLMGFNIFYIILGLVLNTVLDEGNYAGAVIAAFAVLLTAVIVVPIYCIKYGIIIKDEKLKFIFAAYNATILSSVYILSYYLEDETYIYAIFLFAWVMVWSMLPLIVRMDSRENTKNTTENETQE